MALSTQKVFFFFGVNYGIPQPIAVRLITRPTVSALSDRRLTNEFLPFEPSNSFLSDEVLNHYAKFTKKKSTISKINCYKPKFTKLNSTKL